LRKKNKQNGPKKNFFFFPLLLFGLPWKSAKLGKNEKQKRKEKKCFFMTKSDGIRSFRFFYNISKLPAMEKFPFRLFLNTADGCCCIAQCVVVVVVTLAAGESIVYSCTVSLYTSGLAAALFRILFRGPDGTTRWT
jgi:hypothetical protein